MDIEINVEITFTKESDSFFFLCMFVTVPMYCSDRWVQGHRGCIAEDICAPQSFSRPHDNVKARVVG